MCDIESGERLRGVDVLVITYLDLSFVQKEMIKLLVLEHDHFFFFRTGNRYSPKRNR